MLSVALSCPAASMAASWIASCVCYCLFGSFGVLFTLKEFGDPEFSDWLSPGSGNLLLGDGGRLLLFEAGPHGVQSKILGVQANLAEGIILGFGSLALFSCWFTSQEAQLFTAVAAPVAGSYYLANIVYFPWMGSPEMVAPMFVLGLPLFLNSLFRMHAFYPDASLLPTYHAYLGVVLAVVLGTCVWIHTRAPRFQAEIDDFLRVRDHFLKNGMAWSEGLAFPDGFQETRRFWFF